MPCSTCLLSRLFGVQLGADRVVTVLLRSLLDSLIFYLINSSAIKLEDKGMQGRKMISLICKVLQPIGCCPSFLSLICHMCWSRLFQNYITLMSGNQFWPVKSLTELPTWSLCLECAACEFVEWHCLYQLLHLCQSVCCSSTPWPLLLERTIRTYQDLSVPFILNVASLLNGAQRLRQGAPPTFYTPGPCCATLKGQGPKPRKISKDLDRLWTYFGSVVCSQSCRPAAAISAMWCN